MEAQVPSSPRVRVAALLVTDGKIVLVRHRKNSQMYWLLPGGGVQWGETLSQSLEREVAEETGLICDIGDLLFASDTIAPEGTRHVIHLVFSAAVICLDESAIVPDARILEVNYLDLSKLTTIDLRPPIAGHILTFLNEPQATRPAYLGSPYVGDRRGGRQE